MGRCEHPSSETAEQTGRSSLVFQKHRPPVPYPHLLGAHKASAPYGFTDQAHNGSAFNFIHLKITQKMIMSNREGFVDLKNIRLLFL